MNSRDNDIDRDDDYYELDNDDDGIMNEQYEAELADQMCRVVNSELGRMSLTDVIVNASPPSKVRGTV